MEEKRDTNAIGYHEANIEEKRLSMWKTKLQITMIFHKDFHSLNIRAMGMQSAKQSL